MRCPKCGYISFDNIDTCKKCNKLVGSLTSEINGTIYNATAPSFLKFSTDTPLKPSIKAPKEIPAEEESPFLRNGIDTEFILKDDQEDAFGADAAAFSGTDQIMDLDDFSEVSPRAEYTLDFDAEADADAPQLPAIDFSDLDISDLAPPRADAIPAYAQEEETAPAALVLDALATSPPPPPETASQSTGLEDLNFQDLELDAPSKLVSGSAAGKRYLPSVKTGTALDKFEIDLGDLFAENKK